MLGWDSERKFYVSDDTQKRLREVVENGARAQSDWQKRFDGYTKEFPELAAE